MAGKRLKITVRLDLNFFFSQLLLGFARRAEMAFILVERGDPGYQCLKFRQAFFVVFFVHQAILLNPVSSEQTSVTMGAE